MSIFCCISSTSTKLSTHAQDMWLVIRFFCFGLSNYELLTHMYILGKDNYPADIVDNAFGIKAYPIDADLRFRANQSLPQPLNVGYYHK